jgi:hypothetical protein
MEDKVTLRSDPSIIRFKRGAAGTTSFWQHKISREIRKRRTAGGRNWFLTLFPELSPGRSSG